MLKILRRALPLAVTAGLAASGAWAAVNNSHHDLSATGWNSQPEVCYYCHGVQSTTDAADFGAIGALCLTRCHAGAAGNFVGNTNAIPNIPKYILDTGAITTLGASTTAVNVQDGFAHGLTKTDLWNKYGTTNVTLGNSPAATAGFPYVAGTVSLQCTSCHNVHNKANTPFLQSPLFTGSTGATSFCQDCHYPSGTGTPDGRGNDWNAGEANPNGDHPVNLALMLQTNIQSPDRANPERKGRYIDWSSVPDVFDSATNTVLQTQGQAYVTGGKVSTFQNAGGGERFGCYTCHSVHMPQGPTPNLLLRDTVNATTAGGALGTWNPLCVACHGTLSSAASADSVEQNPGLSGSLYYHPTGPNANAFITPPGLETGDKATYLNSNSTFRFRVDLTRILTVGNQGTLADTTCGIEAVTYKPRCTSCHDVHGGINNSQALIDLDGTRDGAFTGTFCNACHAGDDLADVQDNSGQTGELKGNAALAGSHHRTRATGITVADGSVTDAADADGDTLTIDGASWSTGAGTPGDMADGLGCVDCHMFNGGVHSTAHNW